ncbi:MAG: hypothetical protein AABX05_03260 [Nanoarchaeota archaeon]
MARGSAWNFMVGPVPFSEPHHSKSVKKLRYMDLGVRIPLEDRINRPIGTYVELPPDKSSDESRIYTLREAYDLVFDLIRNKTQRTLHTSDWCKFQGDYYQEPFLFSGNRSSTANACEVVKYGFDIDKLDYHTDLVASLLGDSYRTRTTLYGKYFGRFIPPNCMNTRQNIHFTPTDDGRFDIICR